MIKVSTEKSIAEIFYQDKLMPCCGKPMRLFRRAYGGGSENVKCTHCGAKFNICPPCFIERID